MTGEPSNQDPPIRSDVAAAEKFFGEFTALETQRDSIALALAFSKERYQEALDTWALLDAKAERLFQFAAGLAGALYAAGRILNLHQSLLSASVYASLLLVMAISLKIRNPTVRGEPTSVNDLLRFANRMPVAYLQGKLAASYDVARLRMKVVNVEKAFYLRAAHIVFLLGLACLLASLIFD